MAKSDSKGTGVSSVPQSPGIQGERGSPPTKAPEQPEGPTTDGWVKRNFYGRPRTRLFTLLSLFWITVSAPAVFIVFSHAGRWTQATLISEKLRAVAFEQWIGLFLILLHLLFVTLAVRFHFTEEPREEVFSEDNPNRDPHKLY